MGTHLLLCRHLRKDAGIELLEASTGYLAAADDVLNGRSGDIQLSTYSRVRPTSSTSLKRLSQPLAPIGTSGNAALEEFDVQCQTSTVNDPTPQYSRSLPQLETLPSTQGDVWRCLPSKSPASVTSSGRGVQSSGRGAPPSRATSAGRLTRDRDVG